MGLRQDVAEGIRICILDLIARGAIVTTNKGMCMQLYLPAHYSSGHFTMLFIMMGSLYICRHSNSHTTQ